MKTCNWATFIDPQSHRSLRSNQLAESGTDFRVTCYSTSVRATGSGPLVFCFCVLPPFFIEKSENVEYRRLKTRDSLPLFSFSTWNFSSPCPLSKRERFKTPLFLSCQDGLYLELPVPTLTNQTSVPEAKEPQRSNYNTLSPMPSLLCSWFRHIQVLSRSQGWAKQSLKNFIFHKNPCHQPSPPEGSSNKLTCVEKKSKK